MAAARAEERRLLANIAQFGEPFEPSPTSNVVEGAVEEKPLQEAFTFRDAVALFRTGKAITNLKPTTRLSYDEILDTRLLNRFGRRPLSSIGYDDLLKLDAELVKEGHSASRRRNVAIVVRSVLRAMVESQKLSDMPKLPKLPKKNRKVILVPTLEQAERILSKSCLSWKVAFGLAIYAGLRAGEVRALRWRQVSLERGIIVIKWSTSKGETSTPKSGHDREIPIASQLRQILSQAGARKGDELVAVTSEGQPWGEAGLRQAWERAQAKEGLSGYTYHSLRHLFISTLFRRGGSAPAIKTLAGHLHLSTTQGYAEVVRADLRNTIGLLEGGTS